MKTTVAPVPLGSKIQVKVFSKFFLCILSILMVITPDNNNDFPERIPVNQCDFQPSG